jgi:ABC-type multidrug transport system fused ATPase/permease subunit
VDQIELDALHGAVQIVNDELPLLRGTVAENVGYAAPEEDEEWLRLVAEACGLSDDPALAEAGLATRIEEQGANLPKGLRSRIVLARAVAVRPRLLLIDEPGLLMDPVSSAALERAVALSDATVLIVGSEHGAVPRVDRIWRLPEGRTEEPALQARLVSL